MRQTITVNKKLPVFPYLTIDLVDTNKFKILLTSISDVQYNRIIAAQKALEAGKTTEAAKYLYIFEQFVPMTKIYGYGTLEQMLAYTDKDLEDIVQSFANRWEYAHVNFDTCEIINNKISQVADIEYLLKLIHCKLGKPQYMIALKVTKDFIKNCYVHLNENGGLYNGDTDTEVR